jgi:serine/threonine protein kinase
MTTSSQATRAAEAGPSTAPAMPSAPPGSPLDRYQPLEVLGEGVFGFVVLAINRGTGETVVIKFVECR